MIEALLSGGSMADAAKAIGVHERSIQRYAKGHPWFSAIITAAVAGAERAAVLASLADWTAFESSGSGDAPALIEAPDDAVPPRERLVPTPEPADPDAMPSAYVVTPRAAVPPPVERAPEPTAALLGVDADLVVDADRVIAIAAPTSKRELTTQTFVDELWTAAQNANDPRAPTALRLLGRAILDPARRAQQQREDFDRRRRADLDRKAIDTEAVEVSVAGVPNTGTRPVFIRLPRNGTEAPGRGPAAAVREPE